MRSLYELSLVENKQMSLRGFVSMRCAVSHIGLSLIVTASIMLYLCCAITYQTRGAVERSLRTQASADCDDSLLLAAQKNATDILVSISPRQCDESQEDDCELIGHDAVSLLKHRGKMRLLQKFSAENRQFSLSRGLYLPGGYDAIACPRTEPLINLPAEQALLRRLLL